VQETDQASLEEIEGDFWGDPPTGATRLISTVHDLRRKPVGLLGVEDLRVLIAQQVGLPVLVPRALSALERDPLAEGDFYPGDLLVAMRRVPPDHWRAHPDQRARLLAVAGAADLAEVDEQTRADIVALRTVLAAVVLIVGVALWTIRSRDIT